MLPEALILDRDEGVDEVLWELLVAHALTVRARRHQCRGDVSVGVQHLRCIGGRTDMDRIDAPEAEAEHQDQPRHLDDMGDAVSELHLRVVHLI